MSEKLRVFEASQTEQIYGRSFGELGSNLPFETTAN